jgi:hypothetical protein
MSNLKHPKAFVFDPVANPIVYANKPYDLTTGKFGLFNGATLVGVGASGSLTPLNAPTIQLHQNVGDSRHGTVRSKVIAAKAVRRWYAVSARAAAAQVTYIGYKETGTDSIVVKKGQNLTIVLTIYEKNLARWYAQPYTKRLPIDLTSCQDCVTDCTVVDASAVADAIVAAINDAYPANSFPGGSEVPNFLTASKVSSGSYYGVKLTGIVPAQSLVSTDPKQYFETKFASFEVSYGDPCITIPTTTTVVADAGEGWPMQIADLERESQGYDRVRDVFEYERFMKLAPFIINAQNGVKYDQYYIEYSEAHNVPSAGPVQEASDNHVAIIAVPTDSGATVEAFFNAWLTPLGFAAVNISSGTATGTEDAVLDN